MPRNDLPSVYHDRFELADYAGAYAGIQERDYNHHDASSPFDVWSIVTLRSKLADQDIAIVPTELMVWGRGEPRHPAGTKVGGMPVWPVGKPLPCDQRKFGIIKQDLRFFAQFNFMDSVDLVPGLPGGLLSVWAGPKFPWVKGSIQAFWLDPAQVAPIEEREAIRMEEFAKQPFHAALYRTWDPIPNQDIIPVEVDHQFEAYRRYVPRLWDGTKFGGVQLMSECGAPCFLTFKSIQPAPKVPWPWINRQEPFTLGGGENGYSHHENSICLGDLGEISFWMEPGGKVMASFACG